MRPGRAVSDREENEDMNEKRTPKEEARVSER
jgi:hypothetical protein